MWGNGWATAGSAMGVAMMARVFAKKVNYRLHRIEVHMSQDGAVATVFDGEKPVFTAHDSDEWEALKRAKAWIDEQNEFQPAYDLHTG